MTIPEITDKALSYAVAGEEEMRVAMIRPRTLKHYTCATNGHILLAIEKKLCKRYTDKETRFPDAEAILLNLKDERKIGFLSVSRRFDVGKYSAVKIGQVRVCVGNWNAIYYISLCLGISYWEARIAGNMVTLYADGGSVRMVVMQNMGSAECEHEAEVVSGERDTDAHWDVGESNIQGVIAEEEAEAERKRKEWEARKLNIYSFRVVRSAPMYVAARSEEEARELASEHADEVDEYYFELDGEPDSMSYEGEADDYMNTIYTPDGEFTYDEFVDKYEEGEDEE